MERRPKHWCLPKFRGRMHQTHPQAPFSSISFPARGKRYGRRRRIRTGLDGTSPRYSRSLFSSEPVSSFPNRKLNLRFGFFHANLRQPLSQPAADSSPGRGAKGMRTAGGSHNLSVSCVDSIHALLSLRDNFSLIGGIGPWKGSQGVRTAGDAQKWATSLSQPLIF